MGILILPKIRVKFVEIHLFKIVNHTFLGMLESHLEVQKRTSQATGVSEHTVRNIKTHSKTVLGKRVMWKNLFVYRKVNN